jgi:hypothetical protein
MTVSTQVCLYHIPEPTYLPMWFVSSFSSPHQVVVGIVIVVVVVIVGCCWCLLPSSTQSQALKGGDSEQASLVKGTLTYQCIGPRVCFITTATSCCCCHHQLPASRKFLEAGSPKGRRMSLCCGMCGWYARCQPVRSRSKGGVYDGTVSKLITTKP